MTLELVDSLNVSLQFQGQSTEVEKEQRENIPASQRRSNKQELCSQATSNSTNDDQKSFILQVRHEAMYPEGTENKVASHTDTNQLELDSEITYNTNHYSSLADQSGYPAGEEQDPCSDSMSTWEDITICQLPSSSMLSVPVSLQDVKLLAVIDTAAEVTIVSDSIFRELQPTPPYLKKVILHTAGRDLRMDGFVVGPVALKLGEITFPEAVYVAPIQDDMLLGLDFMLRHGVDIKLNDRCLDFRGKGQKVPIEVERMGTSKESQVKKVTLLEKTVKMPPNSVLKRQCKISDLLTNYIIEPDGDLDVIVPRSLHSAGSMVNVTDGLIRLRQKQLVAKVFPVCTASSVSVDGTWQYGSVDETTSLSTYDFSTLYTTLPHNLIKDKLIDLIERTFQREGSPYLACSDRNAFFTSEKPKKYHAWSCQNVCDALTFLLDNIFIRFGTKLYRQVVGIPMGTNCAPLVADLFLFCYERDFMMSLSDDKQADVIDAFNTTSRYLDDILNINNGFF